MTTIRNSSHLVLLALVVMLGVTGCKSKKLAMEAANAKEKARLEQEAALRSKQEEEARKKDAEAKERMAAEERIKKAQPAEDMPEIRLRAYFQSIASASSVASANSSIEEALTFFASPETPVLIVISEHNGLKDYDRPTTINNYLHYLKDQKKNDHTISSLKLDGAGKISEVELKKPL